MMEKNLRESKRLIGIKVSGNPGARAAVDPSLEGIARPIRKLHRKICVGEEHIHGGEQGGVSKWNKGWEVPIAA